MPSNDNQIKTIDFADHSVIADARFNRFDDEFIDKYFNDEGKKAIKAYIDTHTQAEVERVMPMRQTFAESREGEVFNDGYNEAIEDMKYCLKQKKGE